MTNDVDLLDPYCAAIYLEVPTSKIVYLQAIFELYEGLGLVRTLSVKKSLICILTTPSMQSDCLALLNSLQDRIAWRIVARPPEAERELYHGYFGK